MHPSTCHHTMQYVGLTKDVTQGPASHVAILWREPPQCVSMWWSEGEEWGNLGIMERDGAEEQGGEQEPGVRSQPELPLRARHS